MTIQKQRWSEANPTGELRNFRFDDGLCYGQVHKDNSGRYEEGLYICIQSYIRFEYSDHYFIVSGSNLGTKRYFIAYKKHERII
jgi:hypothetical protein